MTADWPERRAQGAMFGTALRLNRHHQRLMHVAKQVLAVQMKAEEVKCADDVGGIDERGRIIPACYCRVRVT